MEEEPARAPAAPQGSVLTLARVSGIASRVQWHLEEDLHEDAPWSSFPGAGSSLGHLIPPVQQP